MLLGIILFSILKGFSLVCGSWAFSITPVIIIWISGLGSRFGLVPETWVFHWADLFLGLGEWAYEPYFSNPISCPPALVYGICGQGL